MCMMLVTEWSSAFICFFRRSTTRSAFMRAMMLLTLALSLGFWARLFGIPCASAHLTSLACFVAALLPCLPRPPPCGLRGFVQSESSVREDPAGRASDTSTAISATAATMAHRSTRLPSIIPTPKASRRRVVTAALKSLNQRLAENSTVDRAPGLSAPPRGSSSTAPPREGIRMATSPGFVVDRSCNTRRGGVRKLATLGPICSVFQELCGDEHCVFGNGLSREQAKVLAALAKPMRLQKGQVLCTEGGKMDDFLVVISGEFSEQVFAAESRTRSRGSVIGEVGLLDGVDKAVSLVTALEDSMVAAIPFRKFLSFLESNGEELQTRVLGFVSRVLFPELMAIEGTRMRNTSSTCIQCALRSCWARRALVARRRHVHRRAGLTVRRYFKAYLLKLKIWRELRKPIGRRLQCAIRMMIARRKVAFQRRIRDWYSAREHQLIAVQRFWRRKLAAARQTQNRFRTRRKKKPISLSPCPDEQDSPLRAISPDSEGSLMSSPLGVANRQLLRTDSFTSQEDNHELNQSDLAALRKWLMRDLHKCFLAWKRYLRQKQKQRHQMKGIVKSMLYSSKYTFFKKWKTKTQNVSTIVTPWRAREGQRVQLRAEGKEYEFALGRRLNGDDGTGYLISPMLQDKTVWNVRWETSGLVGAYYTGSCGRFFLNWVDDKKAKKKRRNAAGDIRSSTLIHALQDIRQAFDDDRLQQGLRTTMTVTPPFGAKMGFSCPPGTDWRMEVDFVPKSVPTNVAVTLKALEASEFGCSRNELGIIMSPVIELRHRTWNPFSKPFKLQIPHRCSSTSKLYLYHWPADFPYCNKVQGAEFTEEVCTAEVSGFGLYAVVSSDPYALDVVYGRLDVGKRWRDNIGKMVTRMNLGTTHTCSVALIPRGCAEAFEGASALLPKFHVMNGTLIEKVDAVPEIKLEGCMLNTWAGRVKYKGGLTIVDFHMILQTVPTEPLPFNMPLFDCKIVLKNARDRPVVSFENGNHVRMKVTTVQLCIEVELKPPLASVHYECMLQGRETLRDIRIWVAKCFAGDDA